MTGERLDEVSSVMMRHCLKRIDQLTTLFASPDGPEIFELAQRVLGTGLDAAEWLTSGQIDLGGAVPAVVASDADGCARVRTYLSQIEFGVYI